MIECSSGTYVRTLIADLGDAYCEELRRTRIGAFDVADADPERVIALDEALSFLPEVRLEPARTPGGPGTGRPCPRATGPARRPRDVVRLTDEHGLIALAEPREGGSLLKPIVGLRG